MIVLPAVTVICLLLLTVASAMAEVDRPDLGEMKEARKRAARRPRRVIYNDDGDDVRPYKTPEELISLRVKQVADTQVDSIYYCTGGGELFWAHQPKVGEILGEFVNENSPADAKSMRDGLAALKKLGTDPLAVVVDYGHKNKMEVFWSCRMNNCECSFASWALSRRKREHPEYLMGVKSVWGKYPASHAKAWWSTWDFSKAEVRDHIVQVFEDVCQRYDIDGVELDFLRHPLFFRPNIDGKPVEPQHVAMMTDMVRRIRAMTERESLKRGRPILVTVRVPLSVKSCMNIGLDIHAYLEEDLMDIMIAGADYVQMGVAASLRDMVDLGHEYQVPVYALLTVPQDPRYRHEKPVEAWRAGAMNRWYWGADGIYIFNLFPAKRDKRLSEIGSVETLKGLDKIYAIDSLVPETVLGNFRFVVVAPDCLPKTLKPYDVVTAKLPVGEDIVAGSPAGKKASTLLRLRISGLAQGDNVIITFNGHPMGTVSPTEPLKADPAAAWFHLDIDPKLVRPGYNPIDVQMTTFRTVRSSVALDFLELVVNYK